MLKNNLEKPVIKIQGIWPAIRENPELYYNTFAPITDLVAFNPLIDYLRKDELSQVIYEEIFLSTTLPKVNSWLWWKSYDVF